MYYIPLHALSCSFPDFSLSQPVAGSESLHTVKSGINIEWHFNPCHAE